MLSLHVREHDCFFFQWYGNLRELDLLTHSFPARRSSDLAEHRNEIGDQVDRRRRIGGDRDGEDAREPKHARVACGEPGGVRLDREPVAQVAAAFGKGFAGHRMTITVPARSEVRRVGHGGVSTGRSWWAPLR